MPYTTVGKHRRVRRGDIDALRTRTDRLSRHQKRSLWLAHAAAGRIVADPVGALRSARANLAKMRGGARGQAKQWLDEWERLLDGPVEDLLTELTARTPKARELRQNSPFTALLSDAERQRVLDAWRDSQQRP